MVRRGVRGGKRVERESRVHVSGVLQGAELELHARFKSDRVVAGTRVPMRRGQDADQVILFGSCDAGLGFRGVAVSTMAELLHSVQRMQRRAHCVPHQSSRWQFGSSGPR